MRNFLKNEDGYVLVTVLIMFVIFSILGLSLMSYTIGSQQFSSANTDFVEAKADAEMRAQETEARILKGVNEINGHLAGGNLSLDEVISRISKVINDARNELPEGGHIKTQLIKDGVNGAYLQRVDIEVDMVETDKIYVRTLSISTIADVFQYSAVTPGNLILNGPSYLKGDVQAGGNLILDDHGYFISGGRGRWVPTTYAGIQGDLRVVGNFYNKSKGEETNMFTPNEDNLTKYFSITPRVIDESVEVDEINVDKYIDDKRNHPLKDGYGLVEQEGDERITRNERFDYGITYSPHRECYFILCSTYPSDLEISHGGSLVVKGDLHVSGNLILKGKLEVEGSIYIERDAILSGELILGENQFIYVGDDSTIEDFELKNGAMYINRDLNINGDMDTNSTIYTGSGGRIEGMENKSGTLVILSEGPLIIANNNLYISPKHEELKTINAFFYTNSDLEMYGVGSNLVIKGGIYGRNIKLNAVKGNTKKYGVIDQSHFRVYDMWFEKGQITLPMDVSRFIIDYEEKLISNPPDGIPTVDKISVKEIDSHFKDE
ncbi:hypothetical protein ACQ4XT_11210 [Halobacillus faecis]